MEIIFIRGFPVFLREPDGVGDAARGGQPIVLPDRGVVALQSSSRAKIFGWLVVAATVALYIIFW